MIKNKYHLLSSHAINKIGNIIYDYANSSWIAGLGILGQRYLGYYQLVEHLIAIFFNPFGGVIADRFKRRHILLWTYAIGALCCACLTLLKDEKHLLIGLIIVNAILAISQAFSSTSFRSYIVTIVPKQELGDFNASLELISQIIGVSTPIIAFMIVDNIGLTLTLWVDCLSFIASFLFIWVIKEKESHIQRTASKTNIFKDMKEGLDFIINEKEIASLLFIASLVNFFIAAFNYLLPFTNQLLSNQASYAHFLSTGAIGAILGALLVKPFFQHSYKHLLLTLALSGLGMMLITPLAILNCHILIILIGQLIFECFLTIFNIQFFTLVQQKVPEHLLGRVFSSIFTIAILLMPLATFLMTYLPFLLSLSSFALIGCGMTFLSLLGYLYYKKNLSS
ncbi:MFS transporter [Streptococcus ictaluri]|uniref:Transporter, major facilitator family protein n=1 Tax=Streptococcus ictaluri 707-05 TaxID=764299 RepID=G5K5U6_9STRE|nr:MFS transporter [Streptococcus ictaluri]EHI68682.1 transporter, major facilitator family protein [Streptococcus ictaluri 707-05]